MITAEELFNKMIEQNEECTSTEMMIEFAKMHVTEALKQASNKAKQDHDYSLSSQKFIPSGIDKQSILNAYPLELIK